MATRKGSISAAEVLRQLEADPESRSRQELKDAERAERAQQFEQEEAELLAELRFKECEVSSVWDLVN